MDKILRTLETIKVPTLSGSDANLPGTIISAVVAASDSVKTKKKERISHCRSVTDAICLASVQGLTDYHKILESVVEVLFQLSSDPDSDIRLVATECLNRLVQTLKDAQQPKLQMEIYKEIKRNQTAKSLRTALGIFAHISSNIKPQKRRAFFTSLLPCFVEISKRTEEYLYENLASYYADIFKCLGPFAQDQEIKLLCKEYITNLESPSAIIRRASASILVSICQFSKKPQIFLPRLLYLVTGLIKPKIMENSVSSLIGSMQCIRHIISPLYNELISPAPLPDMDTKCVVLQLVQIYEMCLILCNHDDHNVVTTSLETLQQLLTDPIYPLKVVLTSPNGIENSIDNDAFSVRPLSRHGGSQESELESLTFPDESPELLETESDIPKFRSFLSSSTSDSRDLDESEILTLTRHDSDTITPEEENATDLDSNPEILHHSDDESVPKVKEVILPNFPELQIGSLYEKNVPVYYCARFLAYNFLLAGQKGYERPDSEVRISVKVLAVNCLVNLVKISLNVYFLPLSHDLVESDDEMAQKIEDVCLYASHGDPLLRGCTYVLAGYVLDSLVAHSTPGSVHTRDLTQLTNILKTGLLDSSNIGVKCAIAAVNSCICRLWKSEHTKYAEELWSTSLMVSSNPYWLVKSDLIELIANIEWNVAITCETRKQQVLNIILEYLSDDDVRVRNSAVACLPKFINGVSITDTWTPQRSGILCPQCVAKDINFKLDIINPPAICDLCQKPGLRTASTLENVLEKLVLPSVSSDSKNLFVGYQAAIAHLSETHPPSLYKTAWHLKSRYSDSGMLLGLYMDLLRSSPFIYDINVHQSVLKTVCNLFLASEFFDRVTVKGRVFDEGNPFMSTNSNICTYGTTLMQHILAVLKLYQNVIEQSSSSSFSRKISTSPVISPVKKFSQKLEAEKKASESETDKKAKGPYFSATLCPLHMKKINESILQSWRVYRCSLDATVALKFTSLLSACLDVLGKMFLIVRSDYPGMPALIEEILAVTNGIFSFSPADVLKCIRKILQSIFAGYQLDGDQNFLSEVPSRDRFPLFLFPSQLLRFPTQEKSAVTRSNAEVNALGAFIRQFEPAVVSGLRVYTTTSNPMVQVEVLRLLKQLISSQVNYGLVDSNQVFLGFVIKQITFLEEGQIREASLLIEEMFQFLTLLTHEHLATKNFVDVPKVLNLCDILVSSDYGSRAGVKCLMPAVLDIIVKRFKSDHSNWEKKECANHSETLLQLVCKAIKYPDFVQLAYMILSGRQQHQEAKWNEDSGMILQNLLQALETDVLKIRDGITYNFLVAALCTMHKDSIPPPDELIASARSLLADGILTADRFFGWLSSISSYWILIVKQSVNSDMSFQERLSGSFFMKLLGTVVDNFAKIHLTVGGTYPSVLFVQQFGVLTYSLLFLLQSECYEELRLDMHSTETIEDWKHLHDRIASFPDQDAALRLCCIDFLSGISYPNTNVLEMFMDIRIDPRKEFALSALTIIMEDLNEGDVPSVEEWVIMSHAQEVLSMINIPIAKTFLSRLSKFRKGQFLEGIESVITTQALSEEIQVNILAYLKLVGDEFLCEAAVLGIEMLQRIKTSYLQLDVSHFVCHSLSQIHTRKMLFTHRDRDVIKSYITDSSISIKYPRLVALASSVLGDFSNEPSNPTKNVSSMLAQWCCEEITSVEGLALAKMLNSLKFTQIMHIFSQRHFNLAVLRYCFMHMRSVFLMDTVTANDVISLFTSESRSSLMEKWPLGVACVEFVVETLDAWENIVSDDVINEFDAEKAVDFEFLSQLPLMWECLTAMLQLKKTVIVNSVPEDKGCYNNFIPTKIFTISFQYILLSAEENNSSNQNVIPVQRLRTFLNFASAAFTDSSFVSFYNVRDSPQHIFICSRSLRHLTEHLVKLYNIDWNYNVNNSDYYSEIDAECATVLIDFDYLMEFVFQVRCNKVKVDQSICEPLWEVISGLGRCELINGWVLISHLRWKPQASWKSQIFPPIEPIPLEILRNDHDLLLQYIFKLNVFGVASKIQFEENWVIFLSVINLYVDENFQLQIVSAGLQALSMLLQQCVTIEYTDKPNNEDLDRLASKIDEILDDVQPELSKLIEFPALRTTAIKTISNPHGIDVNSCIRFLTDLYSQWLQNPQGKMPLLLLSDVVQSIVVLAEYFEDNAQFQWMYETLTEIYKSFDKEDDIIWPHLLYGIFYSAAKIQLETEQVSNLVQILESVIVSPYANVSLVGLKCGLTYLQNNAESLPILSVLIPYALKLTQLDETSRDAESHAFEVWTILLFTWIHSPHEGFGVAEFEQDTLRNILTILSPINKSFVTCRLLVLKALRKKILSTEIKSDVRKKITKVAYETLNTPNINIFIEALKLYTTIFYVDFYQFRNLADPDPEILMPMAERTEILFQLLKSGNKCNNQSVSKVLSLFILDFLPPSEILNRVIAEFMAPSQTAPELLAPVLAQVFEKARRKPKEAALVKEWILASLPNFLNSSDVARNMWSLTLFFIGISSVPEVSTLLPFACLRRRTPQIQQLFVHSALDLYGTLDDVRRKDFRNTILRNADAEKRNPFSYLSELLNKADDQKKYWEIDNCSTP